MATGQREKRERQARPERAKNPEQERGTQSQREQQELSEAQEQEQADRGHREQWTQEGHHEQPPHHGHREEELHRISQLCMLAGKIMLQSGAETYRVEDTMLRISAALGIAEASSFVTPTVIIFSVEGHAPSTRIIRISERSVDLRKVTIVNDYSRQLGRGVLSAQDAYTKLQELDGLNLAYPVWLQIAAAAVASGCFLYMFDGTLADMLPAAVVGGVGFACYLLLQRLAQVKFFAEFLSALIIGSLSYLLVRSGFGHDLDKMMIGSVMPLVPGILITNAVRDLMAGHLMSGMSKGAEAFFTAFAIGSGIAFVLSFY